MHENLVGLQVTDDELYKQYRQAMMPILKEYGGGFGYDFKIAEVLKAQTENPINRVFTIHFPSKSVSERFFKDPKYLDAKNAYFVQAVQSTTIIAEYER